jgi:hypothetical protein
MKNVKKNVKLSKEDKLIDLLKKNKFMSAWEIAYKIKSCDVRKIISNIRANAEEHGFTVGDSWEVNETTGARYKIYFLKVLKKAKKK